jgi:hypothetical protein
MLKYKTSLRFEVFVVLAHFGHRCLTASQRNVLSELPVPQFIMETLYDTTLFTYKSSKYHIKSDLCLVAVLISQVFLWSSAYKIYQFEKFSQLVKNGVVFMKLEPSVLC